MKALMGKIIFLLAAGLTFSSVYAADAPTAKLVEKPNYHPCTKTEMMTSWHQLLLREQPQGAETEIYKRVPYRYIAFYPDNRFVPVLRATEIKDSGEAQKAIAGFLDQTKMSYILDEKGQLFLYRNKQHTRTYTCVIMNTDFEGYQKGDMAWTGFTDEKSQEYQLFRHY